MSKFDIDWKSFTLEFIKHKDNGFPLGTRIYTGHQGMGKTLSMVHYAKRICKKYPDCKLFSNIILCDIEYFYITDDNVLDYALNMSNGADGVLILLDEAHLYFGKKKGIPLSVLSAISQQRKDRKRIVFSSQIWEELDISLRKQVKEIVKCRSFGRFQYNIIQDGYTLAYNKLSSQYEAETIGYEIYKHNEQLYTSYNTYQRILKNEDMIDLPLQSARDGPSGLAAAPTPVINYVKKGK